MKKNILWPITIIFLFYFSFPILGYSSEDNLYSQAELTKVLSVYDAETGKTYPYSVWMEMQRKKEELRHRDPAHQYAHHCFIKNGQRICHPKAEDCYYYKFGRQCWPKEAPSAYGPSLPEPVPEEGHSHKMKKR